MKKLFIITLALACLLITVACDKKPSCSPAIQEEECEWFSLLAPLGFPPTDDTSAWMKFKVDGQHHELYKGYEESYGIQYLAGIRSKWSGGSSTSTSTGASSSNQTYAFKFIAYKVKELNGKTICLPMILTPPLSADIQTDRIAEADSFFSKGVKSVDDGITTASDAWDISFTAYHVTRYNQSSFSEIESLSTNIANTPQTNNYFEITNMFKADLITKVRYIIWCKFRGELYNNGFRSITPGTHYGPIEGEAKLYIDVDK